MFNDDIDTIFLTSGQLIVSKSISIIGNPEMTVLNRSNDTLAFRIMEIISDDTLDVLIENLVITGGKAPTGTAE